MINMELVITLLALAVSTGVVACLMRLTRRLPPGLPPGSDGLPLVGETFDFIRSMKESRMGEFVQKRRAKYGGVPVYRTYLFFNKVVVMGGPDESRFLHGVEDKLLRDWYPPHFMKLIGHQTIMVQSGQHHHHLRRLGMMCLGPQALQRFAPTLDRLTRQHLAKYWLPVAAQTPPTNQLRAYPLLQGHMLHFAAASILGLQDNPLVDELGVFFPYLLAGTITPFPLNIPGTRFHKACQVRSQLVILLSRTIAHRRKEIQLSPPGSPQLQDLLSILVCAKDEHGQPLSDSEILSNLLTFLLGAHDAPAATLAIMCKLLATHPTCMEQLILEHMDISKSKKEGEPLTWDDVLKMKYTWMAVQETLRLYPNGVIVFKDVLHDFEYKGYTIPKGYKVMHHLTSCNFDEKFFPNSKEFNPSRFAEMTPPRGSFMPFNGGAHSCPGIQSTQMLAGMFFHHLVRQMKFSLVNPLEHISNEPLPTPQNGLLLHLEKRDTIYIH